MNVEEAELAHNVENLVKDYLYTRDPDVETESMRTRGLPRLYFNFCSRCGANLVVMKQGSRRRPTGWATAESTSSTTSPSIPGTNASVAVEHSNSLRTQMHLRIGSGRSSRTAIANSDSAPARLDRGCIPHGSLYALLSAGT